MIEGRIKGTFRTFIISPFSAGRAGRGLPLGKNSRAEGYPIGGEEHKLIVVSTHETPEQMREVSEHVAPLFREYGVRLIRPGDAVAFANEVEQSAH